MSKMYKKQIIKRMKQRITSCYDDLLYARREKFKEIHIEGFRCRLDELLLLYQMVEDITFVEACKELGVKYQDVNVLNSEQRSKK